MGVVALWMAIWAQNPSDAKKLSKYLPSNKTQEREEIATIMVASQSKKKSHLI
jgi:cytosine/uracil/thiamine/allantoin permease